MDILHAAHSTRPAPPDPTHELQPRRPPQRAPSAPRARYSPYFCLHFSVVNPFTSPRRSNVTFGAHGRPLRSVSITPIVLSKLNPLRSHCLGVLGLARRSS